MKKMTRRHFIQLSGTVAAATMFPAIGQTLSGYKPTETVRDKLWIWGHAEGSYDNGWGLPINSRMTPIHGAAYLDIPNVIMVRYAGKPEIPFDNYAGQFADTKKLMWSFVGAGSETSQEEREQVLQLAKKMPNITGVFMDDFFHGDAVPAQGSDESPASCSITELRNIRKKLILPDRTLDLGVTLYTYQLNPAIRKHLDLCDVISLWSWTAEELANLEKNFALYRKLVPGKRTLLGIYMWDFGHSQPLPMELMQMQCETALKWLKEGNIEGMIFLASNICDMPIDAVKWSKKWIAEHGDEPVHS
jgi:hypothetical protein